MSNKKMPLYRNFRTQEEIDREYSARKAVGEERAQAYMAQFSTESARVRAAIPHLDNVAYGPTAPEHLDIYPAGPNAPINVFLHGGYWRHFSSKDFGFVAEPLRQRGFTAVVVNFALCPDVTVGEIVYQCRKAIAWVWANAEAYGGDRHRLSVSGQSAGAHLAAMMLATDWPLFGLPASPFKALLAISGIYDVEPIRHSYVQPVLRLDEAQVAAASPLRLPVRVKCRTLVAVGETETSEWHRQAKEYAAHAGAEYLSIAGCDHFNGLFHPGPWDWLGSNAS